MNSRIKLISLFHYLNSMKLKGNTKFKYGIIKNIKIIQSEIESLQEIEKDINENIKDFLADKNIIITKYGVEKSDGSISIEKEDSNFSKASSEIKKIEIKFKEQLDIYGKKQEEYFKLINEDYEFTFNLFEIPIENFPSEDIDDNIINLLMDFGIIK